MNLAPGDVAGGVRGEAADSTPHLQRGLSIRHIQMIALGGAVGVGLFLYSGKAIHTAGPSLLLLYLIAGAIAFLVMRALGELALYRPVSGSFAAYAKEFVGPRTAFFAGWTYWAQWVVSGMIEPTAIGIYVNKYCFPEIPQWAAAVAVLVLFYGLNLLTVRLFGESEFWFSMIKIVAIIGIIIVGIVVLTLGVGSLGKTASVSHLWDRGGLFPNGFVEPLIALQFVVFAFFGVELVGVTAGEAKDPHRTLPKAINQVATRILIFYVGSLAVIMSLVAWNEFGPHDSPFVIVFQQIGLPGAALIMNIVVISAAMSAGNSSLFSTGRMLYGISASGQAPDRFLRLNRHGVPVAAITASVLLMLVGVSLNYLVPDNAFVYIASVTTIGGLISWGMIMVAHLGYLRAARAGNVIRGNFRLPGSPWINYVVLAFLGLVMVLLGFTHQSRVALYVAPVWILFLAGCYWFSRSRRDESKLDPAASPSLFPTDPHGEEIETVSISAD